MKSVSQRVLTLFAISLFAIASMFAQAQPNTPFPDQVVSAGIDYSQASTPSVQGFVAYSKLVNAANGVYSYTKVTETSVALKPAFAVQTQTETGICSYVTKLGAFDVFGCVQGGIATAGGVTGASAGGTFLAVKALKNGWSVGLSGGPSYSGAVGKVSYPVGLVLSWGK